MADHRFDPFPPANPELTRAILARTSGNPCRRLEALACDLVDGLLDPAQTALAQAHLAHCPGCRGLLAALADLTAELPGFAQGDPGPAFTAQVLGACRPAPAPSFRSTWLRLMRRPRICLEAAYLGTVAGILSLQAPFPPLRTVAGSTLVSHLEAPLERVPPAFRSGGNLAQACGQKAALTVSQQSRKVRSFWGQAVATLRRWLAWFAPR